MPRAVKLGVILVTRVATIAVVLVVIAREAPFGRCLRLCASIDLVERCLHHLAHLSDEIVELVRLLHQHEHPLIQSRVGEDIMRSVGFSVLVLALREHAAKRDRLQQRDESFQCDRS